MSLFTTWLFFSKKYKNDLLYIRISIPFTLSSSCWDKVVKGSSVVFKSETNFWFSFVSDLGEGRTSEIDGYCCCCCWDWKSVWNPTGIGGSSNRVGCGIDNDDGGGGIMTRIIFSFWFWIGK